MAHANGGAPETGTADERRSVVVRVIIYAITLAAVACQASMQHPSR